MEKNKIKNTGIMNKMRDKMPLIIIILIIAFLATIVFEWGMNYVGLGGGSDAFGKINSKEISYQEFERIVSQQIDQMRQQNPDQDIDEATMNQIRDQVWNSLVSQTISQQAIEKYGITVSDKEILDWIYNRPETLPEPIKRNFMDSTGVFNAGFYQQALGMKTPEATQFWQSVENYCRETLLSEKLQNILTQGAVVTESEVLEKYKEENIMANFDYALLDLNSLTDTTQFAVTDSELKDYYEKNKSDFKQNESVKMKYVLFSDAATADDSSSMKRDIEAYAKDMKKATLEDSSLIKLVNQNSSIPFKDEYQPSNVFKGPATTFLFNAKPGDVSDVLITDEGYQAIKLLDSKEGENVYINATHVLVNFGTDTAAAKNKAQDIYNRIKNGEDIKVLAEQLSDDPSAKQNKGDLGWFTKGAMVKEFEDAAFGASVGSLVGPVKTNFGFHVIKVFGKEKKEFKVALINKPVVPSSRSKQLVKSKAEEFYYQLEKGKILDSLAKENNVVVQTSGDILRDGQVPLAGSNKKTIRSLFDNKVGFITAPVKVQGGYAIYESIDKKPEGFLNFDSIKVTMVKPKLVNQKKYAVLENIAKDLESKITNSDLFSLKEIAPQYTYETIDSFKVSAPNPKIGQDYALSTAVMSMKPGEISKPIKGSKGYYIVKLNSITEFNEQDYLLKASDIRKNLLNAKKQSIVTDWLNKMQNEADIVDNRDKFY
ncbi:MAG: peptidylprolyl isomerase [Ignavibacteria bacterium]|nr:peptidylprolyl isomerase [Ignavibacteriota bacterium]